MSRYFHLYSAGGDTEAQRGLKTYLRSNSGHRSAADTGSKPVCLAITSFLRLMVTVSERAFPLVIPFNLSPGFQVSFSSLGWFEAFDLIILFTQIKKH